jgi:uncharacterized damage-inducible protein DinB
MVANDFQKMFEYDEWANQRALESILSASNPEEALRFMAHILGSQRIWLERFGLSDDLSRRLSAVSPAGQSQDSGAPNPWPSLTFDQCRTALQILQGSWRDLLRDMSSQGYAGELSYRNTKGTEFKNPISDVLTHLLLHSTYHRGQVAAAVRRGGGQPASTDYIAFVRQLAQRA